MSDARLAVRSPDRPESTAGPSHDVPDKNQGASSLSCTPVTRVLQSKRYSLSCTLVRRVLQSNMFKTLTDFWQRLVRAGMVGLPLFLSLYFSGCTLTPIAESTLEARRLGRELTTYPAPSESNAPPSSFYRTDRRTDAPRGPRCRPPQPPS